MKDYQILKANEMERTILNRLLLLLSIHTPIKMSLEMKTSENEKLHCHKINEYYSTYIYSNGYCDYDEQSTRLAHVSEGFDINHMLSSARNRLKANFPSPFHSVRFALSFYPCRNAYTAVKKKNFHLSRINKGK